MVAIIKNRRGMGRLGCAIWIIIAGALAYVGSSLGKPWFAYGQYKDEMKSRAAFGEVLTDSAIRVHIMARADSLMLPLEARKVIITRTPDRITITGSYDVTVVLKLYGPVTFKFRPRVEGPL